MICNYLTMGKIRSIIKLCKQTEHMFCCNIAGWSSLEARRAHNPKVTGSNPVPAIYAQIAQLVEQRTENPRVAGSIPALGISFWKVVCFPV